MMAEDEEYRIPAEELARFNERIVGSIEMAESDGRAPEGGVRAESHERETLSRSDAARRGTHA